MPPSLFFFSGTIFDRFLLQRGKAPLWVMPVLWGLCWMQQRSSLHPTVYFPFELHILHLWTLKGGVIPKPYNFALNAQYIIVSSMTYTQVRSCKTERKKTKTARRKISMVNESGYYLWRLPSVINRIITDLFWKPA